MDLEINVEAISRLVLGHLRTEKNKSAYKEYLNSCQYFKNNSSPTNKRKFINTRLHGLSLLEILQEYAAVYNLVQEYLDVVGYFLTHKRTCLLNELEYLLSLTGAKFDQNRSRSSTPLRAISTSPFMQPTNHLSPIAESPSTELEVNTTALQDLPGNSSSKNNSNNTSQTSSKDTQSDCNADTVDNNHKTAEQNKSPSIIDCSLERIQQTILEHPEFQAKIAENINSIINASVQSMNKENADKSSAKASNELDSTIKMILQKTEEDPLFERLLEDLIGDATSVSAQHNQIVESTDNTLHTPKKPPTTTANTATIKQRLRSSRKSTANNTLAIDSSNIDVIDKIVAAATVCTSPHTDVTSTNVNVNNDNALVCTADVTAQITATTTCQNMTTTTSTLSNAEIILYDGPIDTLFQQNVPTTSHTTINTTAPSLLMLQSHNAAQSSIEDSQRLAGTLLDGTSCTSLVNVGPCDVAKPACYMIADNGNMIGLPSQMIFCTSDAAAMQPAQYITAATVAQQNVGASAAIVLPPVGPKYLTLSTSTDKTPNALVDLFSSYRGMEPTTYSTSTQIRKRPIKPEKPPAKRMKTILPMPAYKIDILPIPEEQPLVPIPIVLDDAYVPAPGQDTPVIITPEMPNAKKSTPKSGSHVRVLDFNLVTPSKETADKSTKEVKNGKSVKSLFTTPLANDKKKSDCTKSWDANLRELAVPSAVPEYLRDVKPVQEPSEVPKIEDIIKSVDVPSVEETNSAENALLLDNSSAELSKSTKKQPKKAVKMSLRIRQKSAEKPIENSPNTTEAADTLLTLAVPTLKEELIDLTEQSDPPTNQEIITTDVPPPPTNTFVQNKPKYKKKCNIDSSIKQEVTVTRVKEIKSLDILTENGSKLILSPSKLANKRSIVTLDRVGVETTDVVISMPSLDTPIKPTTEPTTTETPFTKIFNEQIEGVDLSAIPTPRLSITPSLSLISPYNIGCFNRPTDYSTSSSYYQPSDSEQNKSLEKQIIEECKRLENTKNTPTNDEDKQNDVQKLEAIATAMKTIKTNIGIGRKDLNLMSKIHADDSSSSSDDSSSSSSSSSNSSDSDSDYCEKAADGNKESVIYTLRSRTVSPTECTSETKQKTDFKETDINAILSSTNFKSELKVILPDITLTQQEKVLMDMEVKRKRTIAKFKDGLKKEPVEDVNKGVITRSSRGRLIKPVINNSIGKSKQEDKIPVNKSGIKANAKTKTSPVNNKKSTARSAKGAKRKTAVVKAQKPSAIKLAIATDQLDPLDIVETLLSEHSAASTPVREEQLTTKKQTQQESQNILNQILTSAKADQLNNITYKTANTQNESNNKNQPDLEAEKLVKGLKQWGIHLVPNTKPTDDKLNIPTTSHKPNITFDTKLYTDADIITVTFDPNTTTPKTTTHYDLQVLNRKFTSRIFIEELNQDVDIPLSVSQFESVLDIPDQRTAAATNKIHILNEVIVAPQVICGERLDQSARGLLGVVVEKGGDAVRRKSADLLVDCGGDVVHKCITDFQMIKDMRAKLEGVGGSTPRPHDDDSLYDFALTNAESNSSKLSKKRPLSESTEDLSLKRPKVDHEKILQELQASDKKKSSKCTPSTSNPVKSKSDRQLLERIDVEQFLSVLHP